MWGMKKITSLLFALALIISCDRSHQPKSVTINGVATADGNGNIHLLVPGKRPWFSVYPGTAKIPQGIAGFRSTYKDRCWFRIYGARVRGTIVENRILTAISFEITKRYSDAEVPLVLERVHFEALKGKHTCGSD
jgi:hypothetical protein